MNVEPGHQGGRPDEEDLSRRDFLRRGAAPVVAFIALEAIGGLGLATGTTPKETKLSTGVIFPDPSLCIGCLTCEVICSQEHKREGLATVPRIRIFNDAATQVAQVIKEAYPDRGVPLRLPGRRAAGGAADRSALHSRGHLRLLRALR